jgi:hypothetical protein
MAARNVDGEKIHAARLQYFNKPPNALGSGLHLANLFGGRATDCLSLGGFFPEDNVPGKPNRGGWELKMRDIANDGCSTARSGV